MMNGFITRGLALCLAAGATLAGGCECYRNIVDPCYPERYEFLARQEVNGGMAPQVINGHVLDQTIWNYYFETGSDKLMPGGIEHLAYLARRRPTPDPIVYVATAQDLGYDQAAPAKFAEARAALDAKRQKAVKDYLTAATAGRGLTFEVLVHDPADPGINAIPAGLGVQRMFQGAQGTLPASAGAGASGVSGGAGAAGGAGGGR